MLRVTGLASFATATFFQSALCMPRGECSSAVYKTDNKVAAVSGHGSRLFQFKFFLI